MKKFITMLLSIVLATSLFIGCGGDSAKTSEVIDFSEKDGSVVQNIKKMDNFTSTWPWVGDTTGSIDARSINQVDALKDIKAESLRFDLFMGYSGIGYEIGRDGNDGTSDAEYEQVMTLINELQEYDVLPYMSYFAGADYALADPGNSWKSVPDPDKWEELCYNIASKMQEYGVRLGGHEIWNEPDFGTEFFTGDFVDYTNTYIAGAKGIRDANPDALVGGISAAYINELVTYQRTVDGEKKTDFARFLEMTTEAGQVPDFMSWHYYGRQTEISGRDDDSENFSSYIEPMREALNTFQDGTHEEADGVAYTQLETVQQHVNEFNIYQPSIDAVYTTEEMLPGMFHAFDTILSATDITRVSWAALLGEKNDGLSYDLIDTLSLQRYPAYHALWMFARLPVDRVNVTLENENIKAMAGVDDGRASTIIYNDSSSTQNATLTIQGVPFEKGNVDVYLVDKDHFTTTSDNPPQKVKSLSNANVNGLEFNLSLLKNSAYYIEVNATDAVTDTEDYAKIGDIVRKDYYYPERADNMPYADIHENSLTAHVGMVNNETGKSAMAVTIDNVDQYSKLKVDYETWGNVTKTDSSTLGIKIDYMTPNGYSNSTLYNVGELNNNLVVPLGSKEAAETVVSMGNIGVGDYEIDLTENAPADWTGRVSISYLIQDAGKTATAKFIIRGE